MSRNRGLVNGSTAEARFGKLKRQIWAVIFAGQKVWWRLCAGLIRPQN